MLAAVTCHFNPIDYENIVRNYWKFRTDLQCDDLFTIELSFNGKFEISDSIHIEAKPEQIMWQKERLLNIAIEQLPAKYDKVAWIDADILFLNPEWVKLTEEKLEKHPLVQMFEYGNDTDSNLNITKRTPGIIKAGINPTELKPGYAWAARREVLEKVPLLDTHIMGGGDTMMFYAAMGIFNTFMLTRTNIEWRQSYLRWAAKFYQAIHANIGYVEGDVTHLYHGTYADRQYIERWMILSKNRYNPEEDIRLNSNKIWEWASDKPDLHEDVAKYFADRKEDEIWIAKKSQNQS